MSSLVRSIIIVLGVLTVAGVQNASAQIIDNVDFTTSFPFTVGNTTVPAGSYTIRPDDDNPQILMLQGKNASVLFQVDVASARKTPSKTEVVFSRYGNSYVLKNIWGRGFGFRRRNDAGRGRTARGQEFRRQERAAHRRQEIGYRQRSTMSRRRRRQNIWRRPAMAGQCNEPRTTPFSTNHSRTSDWTNTSISSGVNARPCRWSSASVSKGSSANRIRSSSSVGNRVMTIRVMTIRTFCCDIPSSSPVNGQGLRHQVRPECIPSVYGDGEQRCVAMHNSQWAGFVVR